MYSVMRSWVESGPIWGYSNGVIGIVRATTRLEKGLKGRPNNVQTDKSCFASRSKVRVERALRALGALVQLVSYIDDAHRLDFAPCKDGLEFVLRLRLKHAHGLAFSLVNGSRHGRW